MLHIINQLPIEETDKPAILFVHGAWHAAWCWEEYYIPYFAKQGHAAYALDLRGHGQSPNSKSLRFTSLGDYVKDVAEAVQQIDGDVIVVGHSMGGMIVQQYLKSNHQAVGGILLNTVPWYGALKDSLYFIKNLPLKFLKMMFTLSPFPLVEEPSKASDSLLAQDAPEYDKKKYMPQLQNESFLAFMQLVLPSWGDISVPLLVIGGEQDKIVNSRSQQATAKKYGAECHIIEGAPHDQMIDRRWQKSAEIIVNWVNERILITHK